MRFSSSTEDFAWLESTRGGNAVVAGKEWDSHGARGIPLSADAGLWDLSGSLEGVDFSWPWSSPEPLAEGKLLGRFAVTGSAGDPDLTGSVHLRPLRLGSYERGEAGLSFGSPDPCSWLMN